MDDLDAMLARLAQVPVPAALDTIEGRVLARIANRHAARVGLGVGVLGVVIALAMGVMAGGATSSPAYAESLLSPLGPDSPLAPSTLLGEP